MQNWAPLKDITSQKQGFMLYKLCKTGLVLCTRWILTCEDWFLWLRPSPKRSRNLYSHSRDFRASWKFLSHFYRTEDKDGRGSHLVEPSCWEHKICWKIELDLSSFHVNPALRCKEGIYSLVKTKQATSTPTSLIAAIVWYVSLCFVPCWQLITCG